MKKYYPEGARPDIEAVEKRLSSPAELKNAFLSGESLEARGSLRPRTQSRRGFKVYEGIYAAQGMRYGD